LSSQSAAAIERVVEDLAPDLLTYFLRRVDVAADAADLLGDTLLVIARRPDAVPVDPQETRLWAFGVARKTLATGRRSRSRRSALIERLRQQVAEDARTALPSAHEALYAALERLVPLDREVIRLIHWEGFSQEEAARIVGKPAGTIRSRYSRARATLRTQLAGISVSTEPRP
jgi:RNA polymerase sigma-70 factor, ECF subfamily